jgi:hypothetical protein
MYSNTPCVGFVTFFAEFEDSYTLLDVYNISEKLQLAHAHYEASTMRPPSHSRPQPPPAALTRSSHYSSKAKSMHLVAPILPSCNYWSNPIHKANECNIPSEDIFCDYYGKKDIKKLFILPSSSTGATLIITTKSANIFRCPSTKSQGTSAFHSGFPH